jgi:hypothetical protein
MQAFHHLKFSERAGDLEPRFDSHVEALQKGMTGE